MILLLVFLQSWLSLSAQSSVNHMRSAEITGTQLRMSLVRFDSSLAVAIPLTPEDISIKVDGTAIGTRLVNCNQVSSSQALSSVLAIDVSGSMRNGGPKIAFAKAAAKVWVDALAVGSECAITTFDHQASLASDFTLDKNALYAAIGSLVPRGSTDYEAGLTRTSISALPMARRGKMKRVVVFLTDGIGTGVPEPLIDAAKESNVTVYCVSLGMTMPGVLRKLSETTGGLWFEHVTTLGDAERAYKRIFADATSPYECIVEAEIPVSCNLSRALTVRIGRDSFSHVLRDTSDLTLVGSVFPRSHAVFSTDTTVTFIVQAGGLPLTLDGLKVNASFDLGVRLASGAQLPLALKAGESVVVEAAISRQRGRYAVGRIDFASHPCALPSAYIAIGSPTEPIEPRTIRVVSPNGGESYWSGDSIELEYTGVPPDVQVKLDVSTDLGRTWIVVNEATTGHSTPWKAFNVKSDSCLLRVSQMADPEVRFRPSKTYTGIRIEQIEYLSDDELVGIASLVRGTGSRGTDSTIRIIKTDSDSILYTFPGIRFSYLGNVNHILVWGLSGKLDCYSLQDGSRLWTTPIAPPGSLMEIIPDASGKRALVAGGWSDRPRIIELASGLTVSRLSLSQRDISHSTFSSDGLVASLICLDSTLKIVDASTGAVKHSLRAPSQSYFMKSAITANGQFAIATISNGSSVVYNLTTGVQERTLPRRHFVNDNAYIQLFTDSRRAVIETGKDSTSVVDITTGDVLTVLKRPVGVSGVMKARLALDNSIVALSYFGRVTVHDVVTGAILYDMRQVEYEPSISSDNRTIILRTAEGEAGVYGITPASLQSDTSDARWSIRKPAVKLRDIRFPELIGGQYRDSIQSKAITNNSGDTLRVRRIKIEGADSKSFGIRTEAGFVLLPGESADIEYSFHPRKAGERAALIVVEYTGGTVTSRISGPCRGTIIAGDADDLDFGLLDLGESREYSVDRLLHNTGRSTFNVRRVTISGIDASCFHLVNSEPFVLGPNQRHELILQFTARRMGVMSAQLQFEVDGIAELITVSMYGIGAVDTVPLALSDPTTFRSILLPSAVIPVAGTFVTGVYDVLGLMAGYSVTDNVMVLVGGVLPLPNRWLGVADHESSWSTAWSAGLKASTSLSPTVVVGGGVQTGQSFYDQDASPLLESQITFTAVWASVGFGDDDSRLNAYLGYTLKRHATAYEGNFNADATTLGIAYDKRVHYNWKICGEVFFMRTMNFVPITFTARYFDKDQAFDIGFTVTGISASGVTAPSWPVIPMLSWVRRW